MSRLLNSTEQTREVLEARNLYTPENPYDANASNTVDTINNIVNVVRPFSTFDLTNTVVGRLVGNNTPLAQIGLQMLASQFGASAASNAAAEYLPAIKFENLFDGDPDTKFLSTQIDFQITRRELQSNIGKILEEISGRYPQKGNPFDRNSSNIDYIKNSGKGQLQLLVKGLNENKYKPSSQALKSTLIDESFNYGDLSAAYVRNYFPSEDNVFYPYNQYKISSVVDIPSINNRYNFELQRFRKLTESSDFYLEYGASQEFVDGLGTSNIFDNNNGAGDYNFEFNAESNYGLNDENKLRLIWGRDGVDDNYKSDTLGFDNPVAGSEPSDNGERIPKTSRFDFNDNEDAFNLEAGGLLSYTRELLNSKGKYSMFDLTKKKFIDKNEQLHFNGSPLSITNDGLLDKSRQHSIADPYNSYVKAIRYNGNKVYNGNENSVIYNRVIPQIVPTLGDNINKNLMFSIENLAVKVTSDPVNPLMGFVDDGFGTELPACERGPNDGRLMWFPPYDIQVNENVVVNRTTTNFIGRGEPIYTYNNTERIATLSFKLIIDYPPQVKGLDHVKASRFFAFGGDAPVSKTNLGEKIRIREDLIRQRDSIKPTKKMDNPQIPSQKVNFYFANDQPKRAGLANSWDVQTHINNEYELGNASIDSKNFDLNEPFVANIDRIIDELLVDENKQPFVEILLVGSASDLFLGSNGDEYNKELSQRRIDSIKDFINSKYKAATGKVLTNDRKNVYVDEDPRGGQGGELTDDPDEIKNLVSKQARSASVEFRYNGLQEEVEVPITTKQEQDLVTLNEQITALDKEIAKIQRDQSNECTFNPYTIEDGILRGFDSTFNNKYKPAFHSQTPEDFHRRLTFLHQCTRQGQAVRKKRGDDNTFSASNAVFGRQPVQILRIGDFFHTKVFIDNMQVDYSEAPWDMNPEGMGMQFMMADVKLQLKLVGGQSLKGPINALQNAVSYNYYANSTFYNDGVYKTATTMENLQYPPPNEVIGTENTVTAETETAAADKLTSKRSTS